MITARDIELVPAAPVGAITLAEAKAALSISGSSEDATLTALLAVGAALLEGYCNTILETRAVTEVFRITAPIEHIIAYHRPLISLTSLTIESEVQTVGDFRLMKGPGLISRLDGGMISPGWATLVYSAGYGASGSLPEPIKRAGTDLLKAQYAALSVTPEAPGAKLVTSQEVADVGSETYASPAVQAQVMALTGSALPLEVRALLGTYRVSYRI